MTNQHPLGNQRSTPAHNSCDPLGSQRQMLQQYPRMDGHIIHALLGLLIHHVQQVSDLQVADVTNILHHLVHGNCANRHRRGLQNGLTNAMDVSTG